MLVVWKLDRLGRNLAHLVNTVQDLWARGVGLRVLAGDGAQIDTTTVVPSRVPSANWRGALSLGSCRNRSISSCSTEVQSARQVRLAELMKS